jgi:hypothetical protein
MSLEDRFRHTLTAAIDDVRAKLDAEFQAALAAARDEAEQARGSAIAEAKSALEADFTRAFAAEKDALSAEHHTVITGLQEAARADTARLRDEAEAALTTARTDAAQASAHVASLREEADRAIAAAQLAEEARTQLANSQAAAAARVLDGVRALDHASSLSDVLDTLTAASAQEAGRSAILVVKGDRLIGWRTTGFGTFDDRPRTIEAGTDDMSALARAVNTGRAVVVGQGAASAAPSFSGLTLDQPGMAVPLMVGGRAVAVLYADAGPSPAPSPTWQASVEVLVRHAGRCLEALTVQRAAQARASSPARVGSPA